MVKAVGASGNNYGDMEDDGEDYGASLMDVGSWG